MPPAASLARSAAPSIDLTTAPTDLGACEDDGQFQQGRVGRLGQVPAGRSGKRPATSSTGPCP